MTLSTVDGARELRLAFIVDKNIIDCLSATVAFSATPPICAGGGQKFRRRRRVKKFGGGGATGAAQGSTAEIA